METIKLTAHVDENGMLRLELPTHLKNADCEVVVIYSQHAPTSQNDWETFVNETYGSLADDPIERGEQPPL